MAEGGVIRILLVEDEAILALAERRVLARLGYEVTHVLSGEAAVESVRTDPTDLILMDIDLGTGIDGTAAAEQILSERDIPVVFFTSHSEREMVEKVKGITRYGYVLKSSGEFVLKEAIDMALELFQSRMRLAERTTYIETIVDNLPIGLAVNRINSGEAVYMNRAFQEVYGWTDQEIEHIESFFERVYPDPSYRAEITGRIMTDIASRDPARMRWNAVAITRSDGSRARVTAQNIPLYEQDIMISTVQDVTEQHRLIRIYRSIIDSSSESFLMLNADGAISEANYAFAELSGYSVATLKTLSITDIEVSKTPEEVRTHLRTIVKLGFDRFVRQLRRADGSTFTAQFAVHVIDAASELCVAFIRDISAQSPVGVFMRAFNTLGGALLFQLQMNRLGKLSFPFLSAAVSSAFGFDRSAVMEDASILFDSIPEPDRSHVMTILDASAENLSPVVVQHRLVTPGGDVRWLANRSVPSRQPSGDVVWTGIALDLTTEAANREAMRTVFDSINVAIGEASTDRRITYVNRMFCEMLGYSRDELLTMSVDQITAPEDREIGPVVVATGDATTAQHTYEKRYIHRDGREVWTRVNTTVLRDESGQPESYIGVVTDISADREREERLVEQSDRHAMLFQELNHRVKNNFALISSLIQLQIGSESSDVLSDVQARIDAIRSIHEQLALSESGGDISLPAYLASVAAGLVDTAGGPGEHPHLEVDLPPVAVDTRSAVSLGLIVNELVTNAIKHGHGLHRAESGLDVITLTGTCHEENLSITVANDGPPLPAGVDIDSATTMGLTIIRTLSAQLGGSIAMSRVPRTAFTLTVPLAKSTLRTRSTTR